MTIFMHEQLERGAAAMAAIADYPVAVCGAGALGANIAESLVRMGYGQLTVIDRDRIEERNLSTQPYGRRDVGAYKARVLANELYRAVGVEVDFKAVELVADNLDRFLADQWLVLDCFDNGASRGALTRWAAAREVPCLHAGMADGYGEVVWNERYRVPSTGRDDVCDYPLTRTLAMMISAMTCEVATEFVVTGRKRSLGLTLRDFAVRPVEASLR
ncbi:ThiF family adenylyltransferase [Persicimonas caeni]|uniref:ThiF family adenylyltransferase n=1 Tax=Persicimonas caeni TaxID=2292766 RepID=A0A4Y6PXN5_PERCE|nr:ThiF family adenylyltransferase [Persicimonas caeni]QDG52990.1 ThiF family adenylyltransferase [Persicimonas caeni]QED34212.1 ThiF family adenylyltransferase [Persicimonas caeni]